MNVQTQPSAALAAGYPAGTRVRPNALELPDGVELADLVRLAARLGSVARSSPWWIGDLVFYANAQHGTKYESVMAATGLAYQTVQNYRLVASRFQISRRRENLTMAHHDAVLSLPLADQDVWLSLADEQEWSVKDFRDRLAAARLVAAEGPVEASRAVQLRVPVPAVEAWEQAAEARELGVREWAIAVLNEAAAAPQEVAA